MSGKLNVTLSLAAGLLGGLLSHYFAPAPVHAQAPARKVIEAQSFVLVDDQNQPMGTFTLSAPRPGQPRSVVLLDGNGREIWRAGTSVRQLSER